MNNLQDSLNFWYDAVAVRDSHCFLLRWHLSKITKVYAFTAMLPKIWNFNCKWTIVFLMVIILKLLEIFLTKRLLLKLNYIQNEHSNHKLMDEHFNCHNYKTVAVTSFCFQNVLSREKKCTACSNKNFSLFVWKWADEKKDSNICQSLWKIFL